MNHTLLRLRCHVQYYEWGDTDFIPALLGIDNPVREPYAELWMGAHPDLPAEAEVDGKWIPLNELIDAVPREVLGPAVTREFEGRLPYLFKVLSARAPLSIQAHPSKEDAQEGFARENAAAVPLTAQDRNYRDDNHKPELLAALTDFYGLLGFRPLPEIARIVEQTPEFRELMPGFEPTSAYLKAFFEKFMNLPQAGVDAILDPLVQRLKEADAKRPFTREEMEYWVLVADRDYSTDGHRDRGLLSIYLLNLVHLQPGEAMYLSAGILHAYLEGSGMEIMANSNNVMRGGLSHQHVDVPELLVNVTFEGGLAEIVRPAPIPDSREWRYATPVSEFELRRLEIGGGQPHENSGAHSAEIVILVAAEDDARVTAKSGDRSLELRRGDVFLAPFGTAYTVSAAGPATFYKATVPTACPPACAGQENEMLFRGRRPTALAFGTSGLRGLVTDITDLEAYVNTRGFLDYLFTIGEVRRGDVVCIAGDLRPSTESPERSIMRAVARAIEDAGLEMDNLGKIPTPALVYCALQNGHASVMITGSHIPFDRNGIKFNKTSGEVLKADESGILDAVAAVRRAEYGRPDTESLFQDDGMFKPDEGRPLPPVNEEAERDYRRRFVEFFPPRGLQGKRVVFFQHSAVGRDLWIELLEALGAEVHPVGRSEEFVAIDTENISAERLDDLQRMADEVTRSHGPVDAVLSTDGDSDRPLLCGVDAHGAVRFYGGDLLGIVVADYLDAHSISIPISANDAVDLHFGHRGITPAKTKIGSPYVIKSMQEAQASGASHVVGWEANGGFLLGSAVQKNGRSLSPLPSRDAALPMLAALFSTIEHSCSIVELFAQLPPRFSKAGLIDEFPVETSRALVQRFSPRDGNIKEIRFEGQRVTLHQADGKTEAASGSMATEQRAVRDELGRYFTTDGGFGRIVGINTIDGVRIFFAGGDIAHIRPSGNAPQLRLYACADTQARADEIVAMGIREPDGLLRRLATTVTA